MQKSANVMTRMEPKAKPTALGSLTDCEFDALMDKAALSYAEGKCTDFDTFNTELKKEIGE